MHKIARHCLYILFSIGIILKFSNSLSNPQQKTMCGIIFIYLNREPMQWLQNSFFLAAEINHFQHYRVGDFATYMKEFLQQQINFHQEVITTYTAFLFPFALVIVRVSVAGQCASFFKQKMISLRTEFSMIVFVLLRRSRLSMSDAWFLFYDLV